MSSNSNRPKELFIISDLHVGGKYPDEMDPQGFRINTHINELVEFIEEITKRYKQTQIPAELVINGDFIDFLAEEIPSKQIRTSFINNEQEALDTFNKIAERDQKLFDSLKVMLSAGVSLTMLLGNHDVELSFPKLRAALNEQLGFVEGNRFQFVFDGEAYVVGDVIIEHGNRYDGWNAIDYDRLRRFRSETSRRLGISAGGQFFPPAGSRLVERIMNPIKKDYPFIDLLKPETEAAIPLLIALEPSYASMANGIEAYRLQREAAQHNPVAPARPALDGNIAAEKAIGFSGNLQELLDRQLSNFTKDSLLELVNEAKLNEISGEISSTTYDRVLSFLKLRFSDSLDSRMKVLLETLKCLQDDKSFDWAVEPEDCYLSAARELASKGFNTVVFGHTHLAKNVLLNEKARYLNTGTWANLIKIPQVIYIGTNEISRKELDQFTTAILSKDMQPYTLFLPTFAYIAFDDKGCLISAEIHKYEKNKVENL
jgi:UDP-2,3-diacylglucosamine pyrophosphatase LpxH